MLILLRRNTNLILKGHCHRNVSEPFGIGYFTLDEKLFYYNLVKTGWNALYLLQYDPSINIKEADKGSAVVVWDREDYLREADSQLSGKGVYQEVKGDAKGPLM